MDALLDEARVATSVADRRAIYAKVWEIQRQDLPLIYLYASKNIMGSQKSVQNMSMVPDGLMRLGGTRFGQ
jgi:ABC-type transport system substrate-binding protein